MNKHTYIAEWIDNNSIEQNKIISGPITFSIELNPSDGLPSILRLAEAINDPYDGNNQLNIFWSEIQKNVTNLKVFLEENERKNLLFSKENNIESLCVIRELEETDKGLIENYSFVIGLEIK